MYIAILVLIGLLSLFLYKRYMPVRGIGKWELNSITHHDDVAFVDIRDYQTSYREQAEHILCIPLPYLKRQAGDIPDKDIILIISDRVEKNLSTRILRNKGVRVIGYHCAKS
ncbi:hypothetical protein [Sediminibacillus massiliensis]|uniref:hypothetical protein n=1 Tax=Sediminibacillus massiliensis TaxID=1926277 RepID=UPI000988445E|nr:hypothetical protein [Sediminibacillus massiliensis]